MIVWAYVYAKVLDGIYEAQKFSVQIRFSRVCNAQHFGEAGTKYQPVGSLVKLKKISRDGQKWRVYGHEQGFVCVDQVLFDIHDQKEL